MAILSNSSFVPPALISQADIQTILPRYLRRIPLVSYERETIETPDGDFLDLDWNKRGGKRLLIITHGLEGCSSSPYVQGLVNAASVEGWDSLAWNFRGCSGRPNRLTRSYHSGKWDDLELVVQHAVSKGYVSVSLVGFSIGGNITLKYLGERGESLPSQIHSAVAACAPIDLRSSAERMASPRNFIYMRWFLSLFREKLLSRGALQPESAEDRALRKFRTFHDFDSAYTAPLFGFPSAEAYWHAASSLPVLPGIRRRTLLINPLNDPMLGPKCYPKDVCRQHDSLTLELPESGGHVGFWNGKLHGRNWIEQRILDFCDSRAEPAQASS